MYQNLISFVDILMKDIVRMQNANSNISVQTVIITILCYYVVRLGDQVQLGQHPIFHHHLALLLGVRLQNLNLSLSDFLNNLLILMLQI